MNDAVVATPSPLPLSPARMAELLLQVHAVPMQPENLRGFIEACSALVDARNSTLALIEGSGERARFLEFYPFQGEVGAQYESNWSGSGNDPIRSALMRVAPRRFYHRDELVPPEEQAKNPFFTEWCEGHGFTEVCIARIPVGEGFDCNWALIRTRDQPRFTRAELDFLDSLLPHLELALTLHNEADRLSVFAEIAQEQLQQSGHGVVVLSADGNALYMNRVASRLLRESPVFLMDDARVVLRDAGAEARYQQLVRQCVAVADSNSIMAGGSVSIPRPGRLPLAITVMPFRRLGSLQTLLADGGRAVLIVFDPDRPRLDTRGQLCEMYRLSPAEADVCWRVGNGDSLNDIAAATGSTREMIRSKLKRVFAKTGVSRQPDLVRLVLLGPSAWTRVI